MKLLPGPFLIPSLAVGAGALVVQAAVSAGTDWPAIIMALGALITAGTVGFVLVWKAIKAVATEVKANTVITTQTRDMADGRLTDVTKQLAESRGNVERLVNEGVTRASQDLLAKAEAAGYAMVTKAQETAVELLAEARKEAAAVLAAAAERDPPRRR